MSTPEWAVVVCMFVYKQYISTQGPFTDRQHPALGPAGALGRGGRRGQQLHRDFHGPDVLAPAGVEGLLQPAREGQPGQVLLLQPGQQGLGLQRQHLVPGEAFRKDPGLTHLHQACKTLGKGTP